MFKPGRMTWSEKVKIYCLVRNDSTFPGSGDDTTRSRRFRRRGSLREDPAGAFLHRRPEPEEPGESGEISGTFG